jgi:hypothetical protein
MKIAVIGKGTAGCLAVAHMSQTLETSEVEWIYDPEIEASSVGEGTTHTVPSSLNLLLGLNYNDLSEMNGTVKTGIYKEGWKRDSEFTHAFPMGLTGIHFSANDLHQKIFDTVETFDNVKITEKNVAIEDVDADHIMVCTGAPDNMDDFYQIDSIPVNACLVRNYADYQESFNYTKCIARPNGWMFFIPLGNRCSVGYLYNSDIASKQFIIDDFEDELEKQVDFHSLSCISEKWLTFNNYARKQNFVDSRIAYNGNASFFLEPLEATSTATICEINTLAQNLWEFGGIPASADDMNTNYMSAIEEVEAMIALHYFAGSKYRTEFWDKATLKAENVLRTHLEHKTEFAEIIVNCAAGNYTNHNTWFYRDVGTWNIHSYLQNINGMNLNNKIRLLAKDTGWHV